MGGSISDMAKELVSDSKKRRGLLEGKLTEDSVSPEVRKAESRSRKEKPKHVFNRKVQLQIGKELFESNEIVSGKLKQPNNSEEKVRKTDLSRKERREMGYRFFQVELTPDYAKKLDSIPVSLKQSKFKKFGNTRKIYSAIDQFEISQNREKKRVSKFTGLLREFHAQVDKYRVEYKRPDNSNLLNEFLSEMLQNLAKLEFFYDAVSFEREELIHVLGKRDQEAFQFFLILKGKKDRGELANLFS